MDQNYKDFINGLDVLDFVFGDPTDAIFRIVSEDRLEWGRHDAFKMALYVTPTYIKDDNSLQYRLPRCLEIVTGFSLPFLEDDIESLTAEANPGNFRCSAKILSNIFPQFFLLDCVTLRVKLRGSADIY